MHLVDTHCHIHSSDYPLSVDEVETRAITTGVKTFICVGTDEDDSELAVAFVKNRPHAWASVGLHPHDAKHGLAGIKKIEQLLIADRVDSATNHLSLSKIVAIGECGLDYFYDNSPREQQIAMLRAQIELALKYDLPMIFHVRDAFDDFWPIFDEYKGLRGVLHSFTDNQANLDKALKRGLYVGVNGISTFTKLDSQVQMYKNIPLNRLVLETDAPFLTPVPHRGSINEPALIREIATFLAELRHQSQDELAAATTHNATKLFSI